MAFIEKLKHLFQPKTPDINSLEIITDTPTDDSTDQENDVNDDFFRRVNAEIDLSHLRQVISTLPELEKIAPDSLVLRKNIFAHIGKEDAQIDAILIREGATQKMIENALATTLDLDYETFSMLERGKWYFAKSIQHVIDQCISVISDKPINITQILLEDSPELGLLDSGM
jgi:hypothetical protein